MQNARFVHYVAEELRGLMDNAVAEDSSSRYLEAVEGWIRRKGEGKANFRFGDN